MRCNTSWHTRTHTHTHTHTDLMHTQNKPSQQFPRAHPTKCSFLTTCLCSCHWVHTLLFPRVAVCVSLSLICLLGLQMRVCTRLTQTSMAEHCAVCCLIVLEIGLTSNTLLTEYISVYTVREHHMFSLHMCVAGNESVQWRETA